jgi:UDP-N-acetyl-D-glucosamine dehydrogenase
LHELEQKLENKTALIGIIGLGYVGLPLAVYFSQAHFKVLGFDILKKRVDAVNKGQSYIADVRSKDLKTAVAGKLLKATTEQKRIKEVDAICVCVPTPLTKTKEPDLSYIIQESETISQYLQPGQLIVLESTTYPGTTKEVMLPILERSGLKAGKDFYLAYSPERVDPGNKKQRVKNTPKVVGGINPESTRLTELLYRQVADTVVTVSSTETAEMTKVFENVFRNVNIALVNELAQLCEKMGISVWEVISAAATKPFGYMPFYPGPGIGGHCIPLDPYYLANKAMEYDFHTRFIELAAGINENMPYYVVSQVMEALNNFGKSLKGANVLVLGVAYKKDIADLRESPSLKIIQLLREKGARTSYNDPYIPVVRLGRDTLESVKLSDKNLNSADCVLLATPHKCYDLKKIVAASKLVYDSRGVTRGMDGDNIIRLGEGKSSLWQEI